MSRSKFFVSLRNKKIAFKIYNLKSCPHTSLSLSFVSLFAFLSSSLEKPKHKSNKLSITQVKEDNKSFCDARNFRIDPLAPSPLFLTHSFSPFRPSFKKPTAKFAAPLCLCPGYIFVVDWINKQPVKAVTQWRHTAWASLVEGESVQG